MKRVTLKNKLTAFLAFLLLFCCVVLNSCGPSGGSDTDITAGTPAEEDPAPVSLSGETSSPDESLTASTDGQTREMTGGTDEGAETAPETKQTVQTSEATDRSETETLPETIPGDFAGIVAGIRSDKTTVSPGDRITFTVELEKNPGFLIMILNVGYPTDVLSLNDVYGNTSSGCSFTLGNRFVIDAGSRDTVYTGGLLTLEYTVLQTAPDGKYQLTASCEAANYAEKNVDSTFITPKFEVAAKQ